MQGNFVLLALFLLKILLLKTTLRKLLQSYKFLLPLIFFKTLQYHSIIAHVSLDISLSLYV